MKTFYFILLVSMSASVSAASFHQFETEVVKLRAYAQDSSYTSQHCIVYFDNPAPTSCVHKSRGIIYVEKNIGKVMCSVALTAFSLGKKIEVASYDNCDSLHGSPIIRYLDITNN